VDEARLIRAAQITCGGNPRALSAGAGATCVAQVGCGLGELLNDSVNPRCVEGAQLPLIVSRPLARTLVSSQSQFRPLLTRSGNRSSP
jgi:hypothetical protein